MTNNKNSYNYDEFIKNNLSNWKPEVSDSRIEQDWDKLSDSLTPPSLPNSTDSFISFIKSNLGIWLSGSAIVITTASLITYFSLLPDNDDLDTLSDPKEISIPKSDDSVLSLNNKIIPDNLLSPDNNLLHIPNKESEFKENQKNTENRENIDLKQETDKYNNLLDHNLTTQTDPADPISGLLENANVKHSGQILTDNTHEENQTSDIIVKKLSDSIVCYEHLKENPQYSQAGTYELSYRISENDQIWKIERDLIVLPPVIAAFEIIENQLPEISFINLSENAKHYKWEIANEHYYNKEPKITFPESGEYNIILTAYNELECSNTYVLTYHYLNNHKLLIPNVFTPDGDGVNDEFVIQISGENYYHLSVLNSEGQTVFQSNDKNKVWDGINEYTGEKCQSGNYYYVFRYRFSGETEIKSKTGMLYLIRKN